MSIERKQSLFIIAYPGKETADEVYRTLRGLEKQDKIEIKTAVSIYRTEDGKLQLKHRRRLTVWKGLFGVGAIGLILAGAGVGLLAGAVVGALIGSSRSRQRYDVKSFLNDKLGSEESALAILVTNADWETVRNEIDHFGGDELAFELSPEAEKRLAVIAADEEVADAIREFVEIESKSIES